MDVHIGMSSYANGGKEHTDEQESRIGYVMLMKLT